MFKKLKMKFAARRVSNTRGRRTSFWGRVWNVITWPFRAFWQLCKRIWGWVCDINLVGLLNLTLLVVIIVLFSMLIIDMTKYRRGDVIATVDSVPVTVVPSDADDSDIVADINANNNAVRGRRLVKLPIARDEKTNEFVEEPVQVVPVKTEECLERQTARVDETVYGDIIIDSRDAGATLLRRGTHVRGNVYIQNMRKYILPCGTHIDGDLFLRDMHLLQFCGEFTVTGNIYVSPRSSFGPIPQAARIGGQVIL